MFSKRVQYIFGLICVVVGLFFGAAIFWHLPARILQFRAQPRIVPVTSTLLSFDASTSTPDELVLATSTERYRLIIPKIGVDIPIIINEQNEKRGLARGAWQIPGTAEPGEVGGYGNMVLSAHRYLYTSGPHTFFNLDKLAAGDEIIIEWLGETYRYVVEGSRVVPPTEVSILNPTSEPLLTLFTCTPVFSTKNRLVITARSK